MHFLLKHNTKLEDNTLCNHIEDIIVKTSLNNSSTLHNKEHIYHALLNRTVEYLTAWCMGADLKEAFSVPLAGVAFLQAHYNSRNSTSSEPVNNIAEELLSNIIDIENDTTIISACKLTSYDYFNDNAKARSNAEYIDNKTNTIATIRTLVKRNINFWNTYGPMVADRFVAGNVSNKIQYCYIDYITNDTVWFFKPDKLNITEHDLYELLVCYIISNYVNPHLFKNVTKLGIFAVRTNTVYTLNLADITNDAIGSIKQQLNIYTKEEG